jgi:signal peptidase II
MSKRNKNKSCGKEKWFFLLVAVIIIFDQITKSIIQKKFLMNESISVFPGFNISFITNTGAGFGMLQNSNLLLLFISLIAAGLILFYFDTFKSKFEKICYSVILGGIFGNLIDRISHGYVVDFLHFSFWPAFNVADSAICIGLIGLVIYYWND